MKIGILTFSKSPSYGATLQCYALCRILKNMGHIPYLIKEELPHESSLKYRMRFLISCREFRRFKKSYLPQFVSTIEGLDLVIVGSDQVWNPDLTGIKVFRFFGDYTPNNIPFISYAASFGKDVWSHHKLNDKIRMLLYQRFKAISVREASGMDICEKTFGIKATLVLDPTLLVDNFNELIVKHGINEEFVSFKLHNPLDPNWQNLMKEISLTTNRSHNQLSCVPHNKFYTVKSVENWLSDIASSRFVLTDSFHGMLMAIKYRKPFVVFRPVLGREGRVKELLEKLGLEDRYCDNFQRGISDIIVGKINDPIDYNTVEKRLAVLREQSIKFLENSIAL